MLTALVAAIASDKRELLDGRPTERITVEDRRLVVRGRSPKKDETRVFLHRGIAARQFMKSFVLADGVDVSGATTENGLLHIDLERSEPETVVQTIQIRKA